MKRSIEELVSEISNGNVPSLMVLHGDDLQVHEATQRILDLLVPPDQRSVGLERFDGRITAWDQIESALRTPSLFTDSKTVWIEHAPYFISRERKGDLVERVLQLWADEKKDEAARLFLDYLALEGWSQEQLEKAIPSVESPAGALLGGVKGNEKELGEVLGFARDRGMDLDQHKTGQGTDLAGFLEGGIPPWGRLLISTSHVDKRLRIYKRLEQEGVVLELGIERERSGRIKRETLTELVDRRVREAGKRIDPSARNMILNRAGDELWSLHQELEKLLTYVGDKTTVTVADVDEIFLDQAGAWVFDLTAALAQRNTVVALIQLRRLLFQGEPPLRLLGTIAADVRRLLLARDFLDGELHRKWRKGMTFPEFQRNVLGNRGPLLTQNPYADYMSFQRADPYSSRELLRFLRLIYRTDIQLKSTGKLPRMVMERLILEMCQGKDEGVHGVEAARL